MTKPAKKQVVGTPKLKSAVSVPHCAGCNYGTIIRILCEAIEELGVEDRAVIIVGVGCSSLWMNIFDLDSALTPHGRPTCVATGIKRMRPDTIVVTIQGDGDLGAIGMGNWMASMGRAENFTTILLNNGAFGMTGGQLAPTTPVGTRTTTTSLGRDPKLTGYPLQAAELAAFMKGVSFSSRVSVHSPKNRQKAKKAVITALEKQISGIGFSFVEFLSACPTYWRLAPIECVKRIENELIPLFPLDEFKNVDQVDF